jgi:hypothetical protein
MTLNNPTPRQRARSDNPPRRFGIRRPDGQWYISRGDVEGQHLWGPVQEAGIWTTEQYADGALRSLKPALRADGYTAGEVDTLVVARLPVLGVSASHYRYLPDFDALRLSTIGSKNVSIDVTPSALEENPNGAALWLTLYDGPLAVALTPIGARTIAKWLIDTVDTENRSEIPTPSPDPIRPTPPKAPTT